MANAATFTIVGPYRLLPFDWAPLTHRPVGRVIVTTDDVTLESPRMVKRPWRLPMDGIVEVRWTSPAGTTWIGRAPGADDDLIDDLPRHSVIRFKWTGTMLFVLRTEAQPAVAREVSTSKAWWHRNDPRWFRGQPVKGVAVTPMDALEARQCMEGVGFRFSPHPETPGGSMTAHRRRHERVADAANISDEGSRRIVGGGCRSDG